MLWKYGCCSEGEKLSMIKIRIDSHFESTGHFDLHEKSEKEIIDSLFSIQLFFFF